MSKIFKFGLALALVAVAGWILLRNLYQYGVVVDTFEPTVDFNVQQTTIPLHYFQPAEDSGTNEMSNTVAVPVELNGVRGLFLLDTGASDTTVTPAFASKLDPDCMKTIQVKGNLDQSEVQVACVDTLKIGEAVFRDFDVLILDIAHLQEWTSTDINGILGGNVLSNLPYEIDFPRSRLIISRNVQIPEARKVPFRLENGLINVDVNIQNQAFPFLLDTGAGSCAIQRDKLERAFGDHMPAMREVPSRVVTINREVQTNRHLAVLPEIRIGPTVQENILFWVHEMDLIGQNFTRQYRLVVDPANKVLAFLDAAPTESGQAAKGTAGTPQEEADKRFPR